MQLDKESHRSAMSEMKPNRKARAWFKRKPYSIKGSDNDGGRQLLSKMSILQKR